MKNMTERIDEAKHLAEAASRALRDPSSAEFMVDPWAQTALSSIALSLACIAQRLDEAERL